MVMNGCMVELMIEKKQDVRVCGYVRVIMVFTDELTTQVKVWSEDESVARCVLILIKY